MANYATNVISIASAEVGYLEKKSNKDLDSKTANAGKNNYTKYSRDLVNQIGSPYAQGVYWCDIFVDWCFVKAFGKTEAKKLLGGWSAYTPTSANYFKNMKQWHTSSPKIGDIVFFKNSERIYHTGIVYNVDTSYIYTIEGNTSSGSTVVANGGCVAKKKYSINNSKIAGYGRPKYDVKSTTTTTKPTITNTGGKVKVELTVLKKGSKGKEVGALQALLKGYGYNIGKSGVDQSFGADTEKAVKAFQKAKKLTQDAVVGANTWKALLGV